MKKMILISIILMSFSAFPFGDGDEGETETDICVEVSDTNIDETSGDASILKKAQSEQ